jgi:hypothetical protein
VTGEISTGLGDMSVAEAQRRVEGFLTEQMRDALRAIEYRLTPFDAEPSGERLADCALGEVKLRHVVGASHCTYLVGAFGDALVVQIQLNVHRFVVVYRVPAREALDAASSRGSSAGASARSMPAGRSVGATQSAAGNRQSAWSRSIAMPSPSRISSTTRCSNFTGAPISSR